MYAKGFRMCIYCSTLTLSLSLSLSLINAHTQCQVTKCSVLICWLGRESLQSECISLVKELWSQGIAADLLYESIEVDSVEDIQDFCRRNFIPHVVILNDKTLLFERKQVSIKIYRISGNFRVAKLSYDKFHVENFS